MIFKIYFFELHIVNLFSHKNRLVNLSNGIDKSILIIYYIIEVMYMQFC